MTLFIQLPDFGADLSHVGNMAKSVNGRARAMAKPSMPMAGPTIFPDVPISTRRKPIIGPVHEKLTRTRVNAMRKMLSRPVVDDALLSTALVHLEGRTISKPPRNDAPKTTRSRKKNMLNTAFVDSAFRADAPKRSVTARPSTRYMTMIDSPYVIASRTPFFLSSLARLRKKLTVIGMIGHTQGVSRAMNPPRSPSMNIFRSDASPSSLLLSNAFSSSMTGVQRAFTAAVSAGTAATLSFTVVSAGVPSASAVSPAFSSSASGASAIPLPEYLNSTAVGGRQLSELHAPYSR